MSDLCDARYEGVRRCALPAGHDGPHYEEVRGREWLEPQLMECPGCRKPLGLGDLITHGDQWYHQSCAEELQSVTKGYESPGACLCGDQPHPSCQVHQSPDDAFANAVKEREDPNWTADPIYEPDMFADEVPQGLDLCEYPNCKLKATRRIGTDQTAVCEAHKTWSESSLRLESPLPAAVCPDHGPTLACFVCWRERYERLQAENERLREALERLVAEEALAGFDAPSYVREALRGN